MGIAYKATGTGVNGIGTVTPAWPTHAIGDVALLLIESEELGAAATLDTANGFSLVGYKGYATYNQITVYWARATSTSMSSPVVSDSGDHTSAIIITFSGVKSVGTPYSVTNNGTQSAVALNANGLTTTKDQCMVVWCVATEDVFVSANYSGQACSSLVSCTEFAEFGHNSGDWGNIMSAGGIKLTAGATGNLTCSFEDYVRIKSYYVLALEPEPAGGNPVAMSPYFVL